MARIDWSHLGEGLGTIGDLLGQGRERQQEEEQIRRLLEQQSMEADRLRASGTVPGSFGSLLQSFQPPPPAPPPVSGFMGTLKNIFQTMGKGGLRRPPASLMQVESQQQTLNELFREGAAAQREKERAARQTEQFTEREKLQAQRDVGSASRQQAGFTAAQQRAEESQAALAARMMQGQAGMEKRLQEGEAFRDKERGATEAFKEKQATAAQEEKERVRTLKQLAVLVGDGVKTRAQMDQWNAILEKYPQPGLKKKRWVEGSYTGEKWRSQAVDVDEPMSAGPQTAAPGHPVRYRWNPATQDFE